VPAGALAEESWTVPGVIGPKGVSRAVTVRLAQASGKRCRLDQTLRLYELRKVDLPQPPRGRLRTASAEDLEWIAAWWYAARREMLGREDPDETRQAAKNRLEDGDVFFWDDGGPVSMACKTRPTKTGISIGMVFTPTERRRRGYATACVGELSRKLLGEGRAFCALFADLANPISNRAYRRVGYRPIGDFEDYSFVEAS
jgi:predicted GNAT family acetyltransferase